MQDPGEDATPRSEDVPDTAEAPEGRAPVEGPDPEADPANETDPAVERGAERASVPRPGPPRRSTLRDRLPAWTGAGFRQGSTWRDLLRPGPWSGWFRVPRGREGSRFEPGPLGLLGVMLAAMAITLLILQSGSGGLGADGAGPTEPPDPVPGPPDGELRIMPVGDAATQGSSGDHTWRYHLWSHLTEQEVEFDFVGPHDDLHSLHDEDAGDHDYAEPDFDTDHAARSGATAQELSTDIARIAAEHDPQYLMLLAGTEDILNGGGADHALDGVAEIVSTVRVVVDDARFVVGELPEVDGTDDDARVNREIGLFNMGLVDLAEQLTSGTSPMIVARTARDYAPAFDNWDATHPNTRGELKIAAAFADALAAPLGVGEAFPRPYPELPVGPLGAPEPEYEETEDGLLLSWPKVPGATDYRVVQRRVDPQPDEPFVLPGEVEADGTRRSVTVESLLAGARYEFVVHPFKGRDEGEESAPLQVVWADDPPSAPTGLRLQEEGARLVWDEVADASHYEVWVRVLECTPGDRFQRPRDTAFTGRDSGSTIDDDPPGGGALPEEPRPSPSETPQSPRPEPGTTCAPVDDRGPEDGDGWHTLGSAGDRPRWRVTVSGPYEVVVRSYRDYVAGGHSASLPLVES
ncbi:fibronectin type III domain-containing protein [Nocardiopsis sp. MG754419]|uniref:fibronectin type III domain-containing protein n=1 Tax=Nocardiopsis sp. MG754419 TaxID=2259865 RepID=UPI001BA7A602|nr:GDSL family lipase [Nocardiopsis sp. MG754419]MBR8741279.1 GDSL family lipase [Nocardiopsis sp. MG754419]